MGSVIPPATPSGPSRRPAGPPPLRLTPNPYGPPVPEDVPDVPPFLIDKIEEVAQPNAAGEVIFFVDGRDIYQQPVKLILAANPHTGAVARAAVHLRPGSGYVATDPNCLPGNLADVIGTIALEAGVAMHHDALDRAAKK